MAVNKRKVLDAARKFAQKGAKQKALKEYNTLLKLDPKDAKLHLEIGDAYRRWGQLDEAIAQYARVADQYKQEGFDARAVAVFKQILNLDPKRYETYVSLSELYQHMGLDSEAIGALQAAADGYHKEGQRREALELLRRMAALDPANTTSRMKVAELLHQEGLEEESVAEYDGVAEELLRCGAIDTIGSVYERILELQPERVDVLVAMARNLIELKKPERAEPFARRALERAPGAPEHYELLCDVYKVLGRVEDLVEVTKSLAKLYRERGDTELAREVTQRLPAGAGLELDAAPEIEFDQPISESAAPEFELSDEEDSDPEVSDDELLEDDEFFETGDGEVELDLEEETDSAENSSENLSPDLEDEGAEAESSDDELPEGDPDQLLAEANVYLRYGKTDQAVMSLRAIVKQHPGHRGALEKLGEAYSEGGDEEAAVEVWASAADRAREEGDASAVAVLRDRIAALDPAAAAGIEMPSQPDEELELDDGIDLEIDAPGVGAEAPSDDDVEIEVEVDFDDDPFDENEVTFDADLDADEEADSQASRSVDAGLSAAEDESFAAVEESDAAEVEFEVDTDLDDDDDASLEMSAGSDETVPSDEEAPSLTSSAAAEQVQEDLEEAEFYFGQGLYDEAKGIYERVLSVAPRHPSALLRLGEISEARGEDPGSASPGESGLPVEEIANDETAVRLDGDAAVEDESLAELEIDSDEAVTFDTEDVDLEGGDPASETEEVVDLEATDPEESDDGTEEEEVELGDESPDEEEPLEVSGSEEVVADDEEVDRAEVSAELTNDKTLPMGDADEEEGDFDLAAELRDELEEEDARDAKGDSVAGTAVDVAFESIFSDFKKGVDATLSDGDCETRYDLAIAYREMGLYDDAIADFTLCLQSESRRLDSLCMMALCALDTSRPEDAVSHLEQALSDSDVSEAQRVGIHFDLGRAFHALGDPSKARAAFDSVAAAEPDFPGIAEALASLDEPAVQSDDVEYEDRGESFEDLIAEAEADDEEAPPAEVYENFDDLITEDPELEQRGKSKPVAQEAPVEKAAEQSSEGDGETGKKKARRKKKISFV